MARHTLKSLQNIIDAQNERMGDLNAIVEESTTANKNQLQIIKSKDCEILKLKKHIGFVHAQRDRLVGFIEGRESITNPEIEVEVIDTTYHQPQLSRVNRVEKFIRECTLQFINDDGPTVRDDPFRRLY